MMMLPNKKNIASIIVSKMVKHDPEGEPTEEITKQEGTEDYEPGLEAAAEDILSAVESKSVKLLVQAMKDFFDLCDSMPHEEGEHVDNSGSDEGIG